MYLSVDVVYVVAPANVCTGGPTALHQLCHSLNTLFNIKCVMAYTNIKKGVNPVHFEYQRYGIPWIPASRIEDTPRNLVVVPETQPQLLQRLKRAKKSVYWLSVDNFLRSICEHEKSKVKKMEADLISTLEFALRFNPLDFIHSFRYRLRYDTYKSIDVDYYRVLKFFSNLFDATECSQDALKTLDYVDLNIAQSKYAMDFLSHVLRIDKRKILILREPVEEDYLSIDLHWAMRRKLDVVSFNARKAFDIAYKIARRIERYGIKVVPLKNIGKSGMIKVLSASKVFIDIGHHPGKDRPAREAAALGNIVLVNRSGGYYFYEDMPIPEEYAVYCRSLTCKEINIASLAEYIIEIVENHQTHFEKFKPFVEYVRLIEPKLYLEDLKLFVNRLSEF